MLCAPTAPPYNRSKPQSPSPAFPSPRAQPSWFRARNADDARDVFKMLRSQHVGGHHAALYYEWAALEAGVGGGAAIARALGVLTKGLKEQAQPAE